MPPRYVYWTIIVDGQPTAFRSGSLEDIMPTFNRLKEKQPTAELKWFQNGKLWPSRHDAQDFMRARGDRGRERDPRQSPSRDRSSDAEGKPSFAGTPEGRPERAWNAKPAWKTRSTFSPASAKASAYAKASADKPADKPAWAPKDSSSEGKPEWKPKGSFKPKEAGYQGAEGKPAWKPKSASTSRPASSRAWSEKPAGQAHSDRKPEWKPKGSFKPKEAGHSTGWGEKPGFKSKGSFDKPDWKAKGSPREQARSSFRPKSYTPKGDDDRSGSKPEWKSRGSSSPKPQGSSRDRSERLDWKPASAKASARQAPERRGDGPNAGFAKSEPGAPKRKWVPKAEYKKSLGIEAKRDDKWRPGGEHVDPKQKYKDAKKAKWTRVKATIRARSSKPRKPRDE